MSKELILQELDIRNLDFISNLQPESVIECCQVSLAYLTRGNHLSSKALTKAASKLSLEPRELKNCLEALAHLFWQSTKQMKNKSRCLTSYQRLGIPYPEMLTDFCFEEVVPMLSTFILLCLFFILGLKERFFMFDRTHFGGSW